MTAHSWHLTTDGVAHELVRPHLESARTAGLGVAEALVRIATRMDLPACTVQIDGDGQRAALGWRRDTRLDDHHVPAGSLLLLDWCGPTRFVLEPQEAR